MRIRYQDMVSEYWNRQADTYLRSHPEHQIAAMHPSWGLHHIHENSLRIIKDEIKPGMVMLELGCGDGHDAVAFANLGLTVVAIDLSYEKLCRTPSHDSVVYLNAGAEQLPLGGHTIDFVSSDHGAFDHSPLDRLLAEVKRVLRPGGLLAICSYSPLALACFNPKSGRIGRVLHNSYPKKALRTDGQSVVAENSYSVWISAFRNNGFTIERLEELQLPTGHGNYFSDLLPTEWATRWPCDVLWVVRSER